jgi:hypothetical protein
MPLAELQTCMPGNYRLSLSVKELNDILEYLVDLHCVSRQENVIDLTIFSNKNPIGRVF